MVGTLRAREAPARAEMQGGMGGGLLCFPQPKRGYAWRPEHFEPDFCI